MYIYQHPEWPTFTWDPKLNDVGELRYLQGRLLGRMSGLGFELREQANLQILVQDVLKTCEIEGEKLDGEQVRSSLAKRLGINIGGMAPHIDRTVEGIVDTLLDATRKHDAPLTKERLLGWHAALFPTSRSGMNVITVGNWRSDEMHIVSGPFGREKIHYEAPTPNHLEKEMTQFITWFNASQEIDLLIKSAIAHFWFVTIHPFDDGNGRIARAIADMVLARSDQSKQRFYSMSSQIQQERKEYYLILEHSQKNDLDISAWLEWYLNCLKRAIQSSEKILQNVLDKARFWAIHTEGSFNDRQRTMINRLLNGFIGKLTSSKWAKITKCSQDTALRDITDLLEREILVKEEAGGRSTSYQLNFNLKK